METPMSLALAQAGLITEEQAARVEVLPHEMKPFARQIQEIQQLAEIFISSGVEFSLIDLGAAVAFEAMRQRGENAEAYAMMLAHMREKARTLNVTRN